MRVETETAVVTGGATGSGRAGTTDAEHGANVVEADVDESGGTGPADAVEDAGDTHRVV